VEYVNRLSTSIPEKMKREALQNQIALSTLLEIARGDVSHIYFSKIVPKARERRLVQGSNKMKWRGLDSRITLGTKKNSERTSIQLFILELFSTKIYYG
jgi:hypothetical protein